MSYRMNNMANIRLSLGRIINRHIDFPAMIKEVGCDASGSVLLEEIENEASKLGVSVSHAAKSIVAAQIKEIAQLDRNGETFERDLQGLLSTTCQLVKKGIMIKTDLGEQLLCDPTFLSLPLTAIWRFKTIGVVSIQQVFKSIHDGNGGENLLIIDDLVEIILHRGQNPENISVASDTLAALVGLSYHLDKEEYGSLSKYSIDLLYSVTEKLLDFILDKESQNDDEKTIDVNECKVLLSTNNGIHDSNKNLRSSGSSDVLNIYELLMNNLEVTSEALQNYCSSQLVYILTHRPSLHVANVLKSQEKWRSTSANSVLSSLMQKLVAVVGYENVLQTLNTVVTNDEVNWSCVLTLVAVVVNCHEMAVGMLKGIIENHIHQGCDEQDIESLVIGFIFARHASQEGRHLFPSYSQWFRALFATESGSPAANKQSFVFLVQFLTDLVPHEPAYCLRAHLTSQVYTPKGCQEVLRDYLNLTRARLKDLNENCDDNTSSHRNVVEKDKVISEVDACIKQYNETGKIPNFVLEASIFRKPYYLSSFLSVLLSARNLPDEPDAQSKLIELLHTSGKIPSNLYKNYIESCQKLTANLLSGVFINVEDDIVIEEPLTELASILQELSDCKDVLPVLSCLSQKIEEIMKPFDSKISVRHLVLNASLFSSKLLSYQVIEEIVNTIVRICLVQTEGDMQISRPDWLPQLLSLVSSSVTLQLSLFNYLLHNLELGKQGKLLPTQTQIQGLLLCEIGSVEGLFLPVVEFSDVNKEPSTFSSHYLNKLEIAISTKKACMYSCSVCNYWVEWYLKSLNICDETSQLQQLPPQLLSLYCLLAPRVPLIRDKADEELTLAHVYSRLEGQHVPDCSKFYYNGINRSPLKSNWLSLERWITFELCCAWEETSVDVQITYLQCRVQQDFIPSLQMSGSSGEAFNEMLSQIIFTIIMVGATKCNYDIMIMLIQRIAQCHPDADICLLAEWHTKYSRNLVTQAHVMSFMNICRCLPPSYFLPSRRLLQLSGPLENFVELLNICGGSLMISLCDTAYLITCVLNAAKDSSVKDIHIEKCLSPIRPGIIFHSESVKSVFENYIHVVQRYSCLERLLLALKYPCQNLASLNPDEVGITLLSLKLKKYSVDKAISIECPENYRVSYVKWLLAYIGLQQIQGLITFFPVENESVTKENMKIIVTCKNELQKLLKTSEPTKLAHEIFPDYQQTSIGLSMRMVPIACVFILLSEFISSSDDSTEKVERDSIKIKQFELLVECHIFLGHVFDTEENLDRNNKLPSSLGGIKKSYVVDKNTISPSDIGYISDLYKRLLSVLATLPSKVLYMLSKGTINRCEGELKATLLFRMQKS